MPSRLHQRYRQEIAPQLQKQLGLTNHLALPTIEKIVVNAGFGKHLKDPKHMETVVKTLERVTGQKAQLMKAKKSISAFKLREGMVIGAKVTLRGERKWEFLDKLINVTLPRVRDFHGIDPKSFGKSPHLTIGLREHTAFPEIRSDEVENIHGLEITIVTTAKSTADAQAMLVALGFPFATQ